MTQAELIRGFRVAGKTVWPAQGRVEGSLKATRLEPRVMELLMYLASHQGEVVTRTAIIKDVWRGAVVTDDVISRSIYLIRKALGDEGSSPGPSRIETVPKRGYRLIDEILPLAPVLASPASVPAEPAPMDFPESGESPRTYPPLPPGQGAVGTRRALIAVLMIVSMLLAGLWPTRHSSQSAATLAASAGRPASKAATPRAILVLPFANRGETGADANIGTELSEEVIAGLGSSEDLRVLGGFSANRVLSEHKSYADIGRELNVAAVLEGSVEARGDKFALNTRLVDTRSAQVLRDETYLVDLGRSGQLQKALVNDILAALGLRGRASSSANVSHDPSPEAYRLFLQGRYYSTLNSPGAYQQAHDYFAQSVKADPEFARGWATLAIASMLMVDFGNRSVESATAEAEPAVKHALELDPNLADSQAAAGLVALYNNRFEASADALRRATAMRPSYAQAHMWLGRLFVLHNDIRRAAAAFDVAYELEPQNPMVGLNLGMALDTEGHYDSAAKVLQETIARNPKLANTWWAFAQLEWDRGELGVAADAYNKAIELGADYTTLYANYSVLLSDMGDAEGAIKQLVRVTPARLDNPTVWAARAAIGATPGRYEDFFESGANRQPANDGFWATLAAAKVELARGNVHRALQLYGQIEPRMTDAELARETKFLGGPSALLDLACAYARSGDAADAERFMQRAVQMIAADRDRGINPNHYDYLLAAAASMGGDQARAVALLRAANERGWQRFAWFKIDPRFAGLADRDRVLAALSARKDKIAEMRGE